MSRSAPSLAFVVPCYNEEAVLEELVRRLTDLGRRLEAEGRTAGRARIVLVDDGSTDATWKLIEAAAAEGSVQGVRLSRNHGHQAALLAGLMTAEGDALVSLDADLQDDVEAIPRMLDAYLEGAEVVFGVRSSRTADSFFKRRTARAYYDLLAGMGVEIVPDHADFRLMGRKAVEALRAHPEVNLFLRGLVRRLGFASTIVTYDRQARFAGETKYPLGRMLALALEGVTSFSIRPLRYVTWTGFLIALMSMGYITYAMIGQFRGITVSGWTSIVVSLYMLGGIQLIALGIIGEYIGKVYLETKRRPPFIIDRIVGDDG